MAKKNLQVFDIDAENLKSYTTTEKDFNRRVDRFPPITFRNTKEDILDENFNASFDDGQAAESPMDISKALDDKISKNA